VRRTSRPHGRRRASRRRQHRPAVRHPGRADRAHARVGGLAGRGREPRRRARSAPAPRARTRRRPWAEGGLLMAFARVRSAEDRLADSTWHRGERVGFWLTVATLGCFTFAWFGIHALRQFHTTRRSVDESWAVVWGIVAGVSMSFGGGLDFSTDAA